MLRLALTVDDVDLASLVLAAQRHGAALLGGHDAHRALAVGALDVGVVVGVVLRQDVVGAAGVERRLHRVTAVRLVAPRHHRRLRGGGLEVAGERDGLEQDDHVALHRAVH